MRCVLLLITIVVVGFVSLGEAVAQSETIVLEQQIGVDTTPPTMSTIISVTPVAATQIDVTWSTSTDVGFGLAGYRLYRDAVLIETTNQLAFSDTGLNASTTYSYSVAAFDRAGNVSTTSAAVATTTFAAPDPVPPTATSTGGISQGGIVAPRLKTLSVTVGVTSAQFDFSTYTPVQFVLRYGTTPSLDDATVKTDVFRREHTTYLTELEPNTEYYYELVGIDRFSRERVLETAAFQTQAAYTIDAPPNVLWFSAQPVEQSVSLQWRSPASDAFGYVRVVRSPYRFPRTPTDGFLVYQGTAESFFDADVFADAATQFYTIFVYNLDGVYSSGVIAAATRQSVSESATLPVDKNSGGISLDENIPSTSASDVSDEEEALRLYFSDLSIVQFGEVVPASSDRVIVQTNESFKLRVPAAGMSAAVDQLVAVIKDPFNSAQYTAHLLRLNDAGNYYEAVIAPLSLAGDYPLMVTVYDHARQVLVSVSGQLQVESQASSVVSEQPLKLFMLYAAMSIALVLLLLILLFWFFRRRLRKDNQ